VSTGGAMLRPLLVAALLAGSGFAGPSWAVQPDEVLANPALEARARSIGAELRCLVCQNQSIDESNAPLARDLRLLVRERLAAGDTDAQVRAFVVDRYGQYVLLRPPFTPSTYLLWIGPFALLVGAGAAVAVWLRRRPAPAEAALEAALTEDERRRIERLLADGDRPAAGGR